MKAYGFGLFLLIAHLFYVIDGRIKMEEVTASEEEQVACAKVRNELNDQKGKTMCKPRMVQVTLKAEPGYTYFPDVISVNRCNGFCYNDISCMPIVTNYTTVVVKRQHINSSSMTCHRVTVKEHKECRCLCNVMKEHCNKNQVYKESECSCKCTNMEERRKCNLMTNRMWDPESCSCICDKKEELCSTGLQWVPTSCKCARIMD